MANSAKPQTKLLIVGAVWSGVLHCMFRPQYVQTHMLENLQLLRFSLSLVHHQFTHRGDALVLALIYLCGENRLNLNKNSRWNNSSTKGIALPNLRIGIKSGLETMRIIHLRVCYVKLTGLGWVC